MWAAARTLLSFVASAALDGPQCLNFRMAHVVTRALINPVVDRATFFEHWSPERLTPAGIGAGSISNVSLYQLPD